MEDFFDSNDEQPQQTRTVPVDKKLQAKLFYLGISTKILCVAVIAVTLFIMCFVAYMINFSRGGSDDFNPIYRYAYTALLPAALVCLIIGLPYIFFPAPLPDGNAIEIMGMKTGNKNVRFFESGARIKNSAGLCAGHVFLIFFSVVFCVCNYYLKSAPWTWLIAIAVISAVLFILSLINLITVKKLKRNWSENRVLIDAAAKPSIDKFKAQKAAYYSMRDKSRSSCGKQPKTPREYDRELFLKKWKVVFLFAATFIFAYILLFFNAPPNYYDSIEHLSPGDNLAYVYRVLGEPYDKQEYKAQGLTAGRWIWCDSPVAKQIAAKNKQLEKLTEDGDDFSFDSLEKMIKLSEEIAALEEKLSENPCNYLTVTFEGNVKSVTQISLKSSNKQASQSVKNICYAFASSDDVPYYEYTENKLTLERRLFGEYNNYKLNVKIYFESGDILIKTVEVGFDYSKNVQTVFWQDEYGQHSFELTLK